MGYGRAISEVNDIASLTFLSADLSVIVVVLWIFLSVQICFGSKKIWRMSFVMENGCYDLMGWNWSKHMPS